MIFRVSKTVSVVTPESAVGGSGLRYLDQRRDARYLKSMENTATYAAIGG